MHYRGLKGTVVRDAIGSRYHGAVEGTDITYEALTIDDLRTHFQDQVDKLGEKGIAGVKALLNHDPESNRRMIERGYEIDYAGSLKLGFVNYRKRCTY
jgi:hypothetical protein